MPSQKIIAQKLIASDEFANLRFQSGTSSFIKCGLSPIACSRFLGLVVSVLLAAGCENLSRPKADLELSSGELPTVSVGGAIALAEQRTRLLRAAVGPNQTIHVLLQTQPGDKLRYSVVRDGKTLDGEMLPAIPQSGEALDVVVDRHGALHAIVGRRHFELSPAGWREIDGPACWKFVPGGPNVACLFKLAAPDPRNKTRWDWFGFGGMGAGIIWPWSIHVTKFGIAERTTADWVERGIVDSASAWDLGHVDAVASQEGDIEVVYRRLRYLFVTDSQLRYERFNAPGREAAPSPTVRVATLGPDDASWSLLGVSVEEFNSLSGRTAPDRFWGDPQIASDQEGRESLVLLADDAGAIWMRRIVRGVPESARMLLDEKGFRRVRGVVALGDGRLIALLEESHVGWWSRPPQPLRLVEYRGGKWSAPIEVGATSVVDESSLLAVGMDSVAVIGVAPEGEPYLRIIRILPHLGAGRDRTTPVPNG